MYVHISHPLSRDHRHFPQTKPSRRHPTALSLTTHCSSLTPFWSSLFSHVHTSQPSSAATLLTLSTDKMFLGTYRSALFYHDPLLVIPRQRITVHIVFCSLLRVHNPLQSMNQRIPSRMYMSSVSSRTAPHINSTDNAAVVWSHSVLLYNVPQLIQLRMTCRRPCPAAHRSHWRDVDLYLDCVYTALALNNNDKYLCSA